MVVNLVAPEVAGMSNDARRNVAHVELFIVVLDEVRQRHQVRFVQ
jgi:hypothetical protein